MIWEDCACIFCDQPEEVELIEYWGEERAFMFTTCCEGLHESIVERMNDEPKYGAELLTLLLGEYGIADGEKLRRVVGINGQLQLDWNPEMREITRAQAFDFVEKHHEHNGRLPGWRFGAGIWNGRELIGVIVVGNPTARAYNGRGWLEVRRLCLNRDVPEELRWNACSLAYGWAARETERRGYRRVITYTLETELGTSLKASGWTVDGKTKGGSWDTPARRRQDTAPTSPKVRWMRELNPSTTQINLNVIRRAA